MAFRKGQSGNKAGRPKGIKDKRVEFRGIIQARAKELVEKAVEKALEGDSTALRLCLERICPPLRPRDEPVSLTAFEGSLSDQGRAILTAMARGEITPSQVGELLAALSSQARLVEADELEKRIAALEQANQLASRSPK
jgi:hypothetical protein